MHVCVGARGHFSDSFPDRHTHVIEYVRVDWKAGR